MRDTGAIRKICGRWKSGSNGCAKRMAKKSSCGPAARRGRPVLGWRAGRRPLAAKFQEVAVIFGRAEVRTFSVVRQALIALRPWLKGFWNTV